MTDRIEHSSTDVELDLSSEEPLSQLSEHVLLVRVARGQSGALAEIYERHSASVNALAQEVCGSRAEDATRHVFLGLWSDPSGFVPPDVPLRSALLTAVRHFPEVTACAEGELVASEEHAPSPVDESAPWGRDLSSLARGEREAITLAAGGCTYHEIALALDQPEADILRNIRSGLTRLRRP